MKDLSLTLRPKFASAEADKAIAKQAAALKSTQTTMERLNKEAAKGLKEQESLWKRLETAVGGYGRTALRGMDSALSGVNRFQSGLEGAVKKVINLRNVIMGSAIGAGVVGLASHALRAGAGDVRNARMLTREFGPGKLRDSILANSKAISMASGIEDDDALVGFLPIARAIRETKIGDKVGGKRINTQRQLDAVQQRQSQMAVHRFSQLAVLNPSMSPEQIGFLLAEAGQGEEGMRGLGKALNLGKASMADILRDAKKNKSGTADVIGAMFSRAGYTDNAVEEEQKSFEFQVKQVGTAIETSFGDIGAKAIERLNERLGEGRNLASRWGDLMEHNKDTIDKLANGLATVIERAMDLAEKLPAAFSWIQDHSTTLLSVAGAYAGLKVIGGVRNLVGGALGGSGGKVADLLGGGEGQKVFVTNWPGGSPGGGGMPGVDAVKKYGTGLAGVAAAGGAGAGLLLAGAGIAAAAGGGYLGTKLGKHSKLVAGAHDGLANRLYNLTGEGAADDKLYAFETGRHAERLAKSGSARMARIAALEAQGMTHGQAVFAADNPGGVKGGKAGVSVVMGDLNVTQGVHEQPHETVRRMMPHIEEQLTRKLTAQVPVR